MARAAAAALAGLSQRWPSIVPSWSSSRPAVAVPVDVGLEAVAGAGRQQLDAGSVLEGEVEGGRGEGVDRVGEPGGQGRADPDDEVGRPAARAPRRGGGRSRGARRRAG